MGLLSHEEIQKAVIKAYELGLERFMYCNTLAIGGEKREIRRRNKRNANHLQRRNRRK